MFKLNSTGLLHLRLSPRAKTAMRRRAQAIAVGTRRNALDHEYADSVTTRDLVDGTRVGTDNPFAHLDEWGSVNNPPTGAMRRAVQSAGLKLGRSR